MGAFGAGLYSGDFAMDLRGTLRAVSRLPFEAGRLLEILRQTEPRAASDPSDPDHTTFWLVVADQFAKRGIDSAEARDAALAIIGTGADLAMLETLGMKPPDLRKRTKMLEELRERLAAPVVAKPRSVLRSPQPWLMEVGDAFVYPTCAGQCLNPYFASLEKTKIHQYRLTDGSTTWGWQQDGWAAMVMVDRGRAFDFLAWYRPLTLARATAEKPALEDLLGELRWKLRRAGTCSPTHFKRMQLAKIGFFPIDPAKLQERFPEMKPGSYSAINDFSMANGMKAAPAVSDPKMPLPEEPPGNAYWRPDPALDGLRQVLAG